MRWRMSHSSSWEVTVRDSESWTDRVTYWSVHSCVVRVINERLVENKTLVLLWAETKQSQETHSKLSQTHIQAKSNNWRLSSYIIKRLHVGFWKIISDSGIFLPVVRNSQQIWSPIILLCVSVGAHWQTWWYSRIKQHSESNINS